METASSILVVAQTHTCYRPLSRPLPVVGSPTCSRFAQCLRESAAQAGPGRPVAVLGVVRSHGRAVVSCAYSACLVTKGRPSKEAQRRLETKLVKLTDQEVQWVRGNGEGGECERSSTDMHRGGRARIPTLNAIQNSVARCSLRR